MGVVQGERSKCKDKSRVFDITSTTIEHIYPQKAPPGEKDDELEACKQSIGNLTIAAPGENDKLGNKTFTKKKTVFQTSSLRMNRDIGANTSWTTVEVSERADTLAKAALKIFRA